MKLKGLLPEVIKRFKTISKFTLHGHVVMVYESKSYNDLETRIGFDCLCAVFKSSEICSWYEEYDCNDTHLATLAKKAFKIAFKDRYDLKERKIIH